MPIVEAAAIDFVAKLTDLDETTVKRLRRVSESKAEPKAYQTEAAKRRNLELITFVAGRLIPLKRVLSAGSDLTPGRHGPARATPWDDLRKEWNQSHVKGYTSGRSMARQYCRAVRTSLSRVYADMIADALQDKPFRGLLGLDDGGVEALRESVFARFESSQDGGTQLAEEAEQFRARARALRQVSDSEPTSPDVCGDNEEKADAYERAAQTLLRASQIREWVVVGGSPLRRRASGSSRVSIKKKAP